MRPTTATTRPTWKPTRSKVLTGMFVAPLLLASCGDDGGADAAYAEFCDAELAVERTSFDANMSEDGGDALETAMGALVAASPDDETRAKVQATIDAFGELEGPPGPEFNAIYGELMTVVKDKCGFNELSAQAADYQFSGLDAEVETGPTFVTFENKGTEFHEMFIMRRNDGDDTPIADLLSMEEEEAMAHVRPVAAAFADPGTTSYTAVELEPGIYVVACFIPQGSTPDAWEEMMASGAEPDGQPHAMLGMTAEFEATS